MCAGTPNENNGYKLDPNGMIFFRGSDDEDSVGWVTRIRMWSTALSANDVADASGCSLPEEGSACVGLIEMNVPYDRISASSVWYGYAISQGWGQVQLNSPGSWAPGSWDQNQWIQLDTGAIQMIAGVVTQGTFTYTAHLHIVAVQI